MVQIVPHRPVCVFQHSTANGRCGFTNDTQNIKKRKINFKMYNQNPARLLYTRKKKILKFYNSFHVMGVSGPPYIYGMGK